MRGGGRRLALGLLLIGIACQGVAASPDGRPEAGAFLRFAQQLVRAAFPKLAGDSRTAISITLLPTMDRDWYPSGASGHVFIEVFRRVAVDTGPRPPNAGYSDETRSVPLVRA